MHPIVSRFMPSATAMLRTDHSHVLMTFHKYRAGKAPATRLLPVRAACLALEIHAQLEEEIFYPACRAAGIDSAVLEKSLPEHAEMRRVIGELRALDPASSAFDEAFMNLMRIVIHHVADEETVLFADAERVLGADRLAELGMEMTRRRLQLAAPHAGEIAADTVRTAKPASLLVAAGALLAGGYVVKRAFGRGNHVTRT